MKQSSSKITDVLAMLVFTVFALCILLVLLTGAGAYRDLVERSGIQFDRRTAARYLTTRVRQAEALAVGDFAGCPALLLREETEEGVYLTRIYFHEGSIRELYCEASARLLPEDGEPVLEAEALEFSLEGDRLTVDLGQESLLFHIPVGMEVGP